MEKYKQVDCLGKGQRGEAILNHATLEDSCKNKTKRNGLCYPRDQRKCCFTLLRLDLCDGVRPQYF